MKWPCFMVLMATCDDFEELNRREEEDLTVLGEETLLATGREWTPLSALLRRQIERIRKRDFAEKCENLNESFEQFTPDGNINLEAPPSDELPLIDEVLSALKHQLTGLIMEFEEVVGKFRERQRALHAQMRQEREDRRVKEEDLAAQLTDLDQSILVLRDSLPTLSQGDAGTISHLRDQVTGAQQSVRRLVLTAEQAANAGLELSEGATLREGIVVLHNSVQKLGQALSELGCVLTSKAQETITRPVASLRPVKPSSVTKGKAQDTVSNPVARHLPDKPSSAAQTKPQDSDLADQMSEEVPSYTLATAALSPLPSKGETWKVIRDDDSDFIPPVRGPSIGTLGTLQDADYRVRTAESDSDVSRQRRYPYESALNKFWAHPDTETSFERTSSPSGMESTSGSRQRSLVDVEAWLSTQGSDACYAVSSDSPSFGVDTSAGTPSGASARYSTPMSSTLGTLSVDSASTYASGRSDVTGGFTPRSTTPKEVRSRSPHGSSEHAKSTPRKVPNARQKSGETAVSNASAAECEGKVQQASLPSAAKQSVPVSTQPCEKRVSKRNSMVGLFPCTTLTPPEDRVQQKVRYSHRGTPFHSYISTDQGNFRKTEASAASLTSEERKDQQFTRRAAAPTLQGKARLSFVQGTEASWARKHGGSISSLLKLASPVLKRSLVISFSVLLLGLLLTFVVLLFLPREVNLELKSTLSNYAIGSHVFKVKNFGLPPT